MEVREMKAWVLESPGELRLKSVPAPKAGDNDILVKVETVCICNGSDPEIFRGHEAYTPPLVFGHEASGEIIETGKNVNGWRAGQKVCWWFTTGGFAEYAVVNPGEAAVFPVPESLSPEEAPVLELAIAASRAVMPFTENTAGKTLGILGLGPSGLVALQYAKALGFSYVWGWDLYPKRRELALSLGADKVYDPASPGFSREMDSMAEADMVIDMMGDEQLRESVFTKLLRKAKPSGTVVTYGHPEHGRLFSPFVFQSRNLTMISPENRLPVIREKGKRLMEWIGEGKIRIRPLVTDIRPFEDIKDAFEKLMENSGEQIKIVFKV